MAMMQPPHISQMQCGYLMMEIWPRVIQLPLIQQRVHDPMELNQEEPRDRALRRIHTDFCNMPVYLLPGVMLQIKFTKTKSSFYLMNKDAESKSQRCRIEIRLSVSRCSTVGQTN
jgi:hypothetical protein